MVLHVVRIAHHAPHEGAAGPGLVGEALGDEAAGAALSSGEGEALLLQQAEADGFQLGLIHGVNEIPQLLPHLLDHGLQHGLRRSLVRGHGGGPQTHLRGARIGGQGGIHKALHIVVEPCLHAALPQAEDADILTDKYLVRTSPEIGDHPGLQHEAHLPGRAGQLDHRGAVRDEGEAGRGAVKVGENGAALRQHGLAQVVFRHYPVFLSEEGPDLLRLLLMQLERHAENFADDVLGQVVVGGAQAPGGDDEVGPVPGRLHGLPQPGGVVPHHALPIDADAQAPEGGAQLFRVGVHDVPQQELRAHAEDLCLPLFSFHA